MPLPHTGERQGEGVRAPNGAPRMNQRAPSPRPLPHAARGERGNIALEARGITHGGSSPASRRRRGARRHRLRVARRSIKASTGCASLLSRRAMRARQSGASPASRRACRPRARRPRRARRHRRRMRARRGLPRRRRAGARAGASSCRSRSGALLRHMISSSSAREKAAHHRADRRALGLERCAPRRRGRSPRRASSRASRPGPRRRALSRRERHLGRGPRCGRRAASRARRAMAPRASRPTSTSRRVEGPCRDRTRCAELEIAADPAIDRNIHRIEVEADSARLTMTIENVLPRRIRAPGKVTALS